MPSTRHLWITFLVPSAPNRPQCAASLLFAEIIGPRWVHVSAAKKNNIDSIFLRLCQSDLQKKKTEINGINFKSGCCDKID